MNAPWSPTRSAALRDPFIAFVCDDHAADAIRPKDPAQSSQGSGQGVVK